MAVYWSNYSNGNGNIFKIFGGWRLKIEYQSNHRHTNKKTFKIFCYGISKKTKKLYVRDVRKRDFLNHLFVFGNKHRANYSKMKTKKIMFPFSLNDWTGLSGLLFVFKTSSFAVSEDGSLVDCKPCLSCTICPCVAASLSGRCFEMM